MFTTLKQIKADGGATLTKAGIPMDYKRGYQVSIQDLEVIKVRDLRKKHIQEMLDKLSASSSLGIWIDKGLAYIDSSKYFSVKRDAMREGRKNKQISIFNWKDKQAIFL